LSDSTRNQVGKAGAGNTITKNGQDGLAFTGDSTGTEAQANTILLNQANGVSLSNVVNATIGGYRRMQGNVIAGNVASGIAQSGINPGTVIKGNTVVANGQ
jgi:hypothetical protein